jgi:hypothetical protein
MKYRITWSEMLLFDEDVEAPTAEEARQLALDKVYGLDTKLKSGDDVFRSAMSAEIGEIDVEEVE